MRILFDDGTLLLKDAPERVPHAGWDDRVDEYRAQAYRYQALLRWADQSEGQATLQETTATIETLDDVARAYRDSS
jgi:hypothetical protein